MAEVNTHTFRVSSIATKIFVAGQPLHEFILNEVPQGLVQEKMVLLVTSKIVSLAEGRLLPRSEAPSKLDLVKQESDFYLGEIAMGVGLTIKEGLLIASAGIDESNSCNGDYILYPEDPWRSVGELWEKLRLSWEIKDLAVILTDSRTEPLKQGVGGVGLCFWGFSPVEDLREGSDLFGRPFKMTTRNLVDSLASAGVLAMGEGTEPRPLAVVSGVQLDFRDTGFSETNAETLRSLWKIKLEDDLYYPLYEARLKLAQTSN